MLVWFLLALSAAIANSLSQTLQKQTVAVSGYSKVTIAFIATTLAAAILLTISYFIIGLPQVDSLFWSAIIVTGLLNAIAWPLILKAYEIGEFSSVYSMILLTPVFLLITSFIFLGETPSPLGVAGVLVTVAGLWVIASQHKHTAVPDFARGNWLGVLVAGIFSVSINFDKIAVQHSDRFLGSAATLGAVAITSALYLLFRHQRIFIRVGGGAKSGHPLLFLGAAGMVVLATIIHNSALLAGLVTYTIAVKRLGIFFGVIWGWLFFKEKNISKKLLGAVIAVAGVIAILLS